MKGSDLIFGTIQLLYCKCHKIDFKLSGSYIVAWRKNKKAAINSKNKDDRCFQYVASVALNFDEIKKDPQILNHLLMNISEME